jgi:outer membrane protein assembly factor BamD (BamD/ComL family)
VAAAIVMAGVPAVVAMQFPISDVAAIRFASRFYPLAALGEPVDYAVAEGRRAIRVAESDTMEWATPILFMRAPDGVLFRVAERHREKRPRPQPPILDREVEQRLEQLYIAGLGAFWLEEWDRACHSFQEIVDERPDYKDAAAKLEEAERKWHQNELYRQAQDARQAGNWTAVLAKLEELVAEDPAYKDAAALLELARRQKQLADLYAQARQLHQAGQWQAVVRVFDQIVALDPDYPDPDDLLATAEREAAELERQADLNDRYSRAVLEMEAGRWQQARQVLDRLQEMEPDYRGADRLLERAEAEIARQEAERRRQEQIAALYERAVSRAEAGQWAQALDRMDEIHALAPEFADPQGVAARARAEIERQRRLEALYAQAQAAHDSQDWPAALAALQALVGEEAGYRDAAALLAGVERQQALAGLYAQAQQEHRAGEWQAVVDTFARIAAVEPGYADPDGLLAAAERSLAGQQRWAELDDLYNRAAQAMEAGDWAQARPLLAQIREREPGYRQAEQMLVRAEAGLEQAEAERQRQEQVATLYEQAQSLARARQWRPALAKMDEIRALDAGFADPEGIAARARERVAQEEAEARRQNELAALYAEAVRLVKAEQYQEALQKWAEVQTLDPRYPDRKKVQGTARKKLTSLDRPYPYDAADGREDPEPAGRRVVRGGSLGADQWSIRTVFRERRSPDETVIGLSFRCVRSASEPAQASSAPRDTTPTPPPGTEVIAIAQMAPSIPWLPYDRSSVPATLFLEFNLSKPPFDNVQVRQAFALAVNRATVANVAASVGVSDPRPATTFTHPEVLGRDLYRQVGLGEDPDRARQSLAEAGYPNGSGFPRITAVFNCSDRYLLDRSGQQAIAQAIVAMWEDNLQIGMDLECVEVWADYVARLDTDAPAIFHLGWVADHIDPDNFLPYFSTGSGAPRSHFSNSEFNHLVEAGAAAAGNPAARQALYIQAERILCEQEAVIIPLYHFHSRQ